jgi:CO/xanthine dehydrogenase FAD-binding subunit
VRAFRYARPGSLEEALALLDQYGPEAKILAGGTDLLVRIRTGHTLPRIVIDIKRVAALGTGIAETGSTLRFSACTTVTSILADQRVKHHFPALADAARVVGSVQIRNRATLTGNICNASPAADTAPALLVYGAIVNMTGKTGRRSVPLSEFFTGPGKTVLNRDEIVESIDLPLPPKPTGAAFGRVTRRWGVDLATINLCCAVDGSGKARFAYGAAAPRPVLVEDSSGVLSDPAAGAAEKDAVLRRLISHTSPRTDVRGGRDYRESMLLVMSRRALGSAIERLRRAEDEAA